MIEFPKTLPSQGFLIIALDPLETMNDIDRLDNFFIQSVKFTDEEIIKAPYVDWIPIGNFMDMK